MSSIPRNMQTRSFLQLLENHKILKGRSSKCNAEKGNDTFEDIDDRESKIISNLVKEDKFDHLKEYVLMNQFDFNGFIPSDFFNFSAQIPVLSFSVMNGSINCFKFLLLNGSDPRNKVSQCSRGFDWDCGGVGGAFGQFEMLKILRDREFGVTCDIIRGLILSYHNKYMKQLLIDHNWVFSNDKQNLYWMSIQSNNIEGFLEICDIGEIRNNIKAGNRWLLEHAAVHNNKFIAELLILEGGHVNYEAHFGTNLLHCAALNNGREVAELLLSKGTNINCTDEFKCTPLNYAVDTNSKDVAELLIKKGANLHNEIGDRKMTALHVAALNNYPQIAELLIENGANINYVDCNCHTPLHLGVQENNKDIVELLILKGANLNLEDKWKCTPIHYAAQKNYKDIAELLILNGAIIKFENVNKYTPLHAAAAGNYKEIAELLILNGANINCEDEHQYTPLHTAAEYNCREVAELLILHGANIDNDQGKYTPLHLACEFNCIEVAELLILNGANINCKTICKHTPLWYAKLAGNEKIVKLLLLHGGDANYQDDDEKNSSPT